LDSFLTSPGILNQESDPSYSSGGASFRTPLRDLGRVAIGPFDPGTPQN
jgi:hypothetical protein